jgi:xylulokinase
MMAWADEAPPGANGLLFLPYLVGERSPHMDPHARGLFLGLTAQHGRPEFVRAVIEGVTLSCYDAFASLLDLVRRRGEVPQRIVLAGGGARSPLWRQIVADVFDLPVRPLATSEQSALGAALLAGAGTGYVNPLSATRAWASYGDEVAPQPEAHRRYEKLLWLFRDAYQKHRDDFERLASLS